ncbi:hypothetical protein RHECNPAF_110014 [Rhizobium etli CNPAF512]|nr:hypothetical protein RHECNPAF_110014 [Rhizobium etli CNPAF512]
MGCLALGSGGAPSRLDDRQPYQRRHSRGPRGGLIGSETDLLPSARERHPGQAHLLIPPAANDTLNKGCIFLYTHLESTKVVLYVFIHGNHEQDTASIAAALHAGA